MSITSAAATVTTEEDARRHGSTDVKLWLDKINTQLEDDTEKAWRDEARLAVAVYEAVRDNTGIAGYAGRPVFNIFHSNIQTLGPAVYNSSPVPDVRRKFGDRDPVARMASQIAERALEATLDSHDFDGVMKAAVRSACVAGRGVTRVRYQPYFKPSQDVDGTEYEAVAHEDVLPEHVGWDRYVQGPARDWLQVPWIAFPHDLTKDEVERLIMPEAPRLPPAPVIEPTDDQDANEIIAEAHKAAMRSHVERVAALMDQHKARVEEATKRLESLPFGGSHKDRDGNAARPEKGILKTVPVWEIWDKRGRKVLFITAGDEKLPLAVHDDPLGLSGFFPIPPPLQEARRVSSLIPMCPHNVYADLVGEIEDTTRRIKATIDDMRIRAISDPKLQADIEALSKSDDGDVMASNAAELFGPNGAPDLTKLVLWWPIEQDVKVLDQLMKHREAVKQIIYEVTGLSDILRGATAASETATAQNIKATWGSQRVRDLQSEVARYARDLFRLMAEVIFGKFQDQTIQQMVLMPEPVDSETIAGQVAERMQAQQPGQPATGANGAPPAPVQSPSPEQIQAAQQQAVAQAEQEAEAKFQEALRVLRSELRWYRVDIETDSTIKATLAVDQQQVNDFVGMTGNYMTAVAAVAQLFPQVAPHMLDLWGQIAQKSYKLGKGADEILDKLVDAAHQAVATGAIGTTPQQSPEDAAAQREHEASGQQSQQQHDESMAQADIAKIEAKDQAGANAHARTLQKMQMQAALPPTGGMPAQDAGFMQ